MMLEEIARRFLSRINPLILGTLLCLPILLSFALLFIKNNQLQEIEQAFFFSIQKGPKILHHKLEKEAFLKRYTGSTPYFLHQMTHSLSLLEREKKILNEWLFHPAIRDKETIYGRLLEIEEGKNRLAFIEEEVRSAPKIKETEEALREPVEVDEEDLKKILGLLEDLSCDALNPPQIIITDFHLEKKETPLKMEYFSLEMKLLTREFSR